MLVLTRKIGEQIQIGDGIVVTVVDCGRSRVSLGISAPPEVRIRRSEMAAAASTPGRILIVEDNPADRELYRRLLSQDGVGSYQFVEAGSAEQGLSLLGSEDPDCILLDYRLPDLDGIEFLAQSVARRRSSGCAVVMLTNYTSEDLPERARAGGASDFLKKQGLTAETLRARVGAAVAIRRAPTPPISAV